MPETPTRGSLEMITNPGQPTATSDGLVVAAMTADLVPTILTAVYALTDVQSADPAAGQIAAWTATNDRLQSVRVILWPETLPQGREIEGGDV